MTKYYHKLYSKQEQIEFLTYLESLNEGYLWRNGDKPLKFIPADRVNRQSVTIYIESNKRLAQGSIDIHHDEYKPYPYKPNPYNF